MNNCIKSITNTLRQEMLKSPFQLKENFFWISHKSKTAFLFKISILNICMYQLLSLKLTIIPFLALITNSIKGSTLWSGSNEISNLKEIMIYQIYFLVYHVCSLAFIFDKLYHPYFSGILFTICFYQIH